LNSESKLSLLIPTYDGRYGRLTRTLTYLSEIAVADLIPSGRAAKIEVIIADGTDADLKNVELSKIKFLEALNTASELLSISYLELPGMSYFQRVFRLVEASSSPYVSLLGDEDLFVFDCIDEIFEIFEEGNVNAVCGRYVDIHGYIRGRLKMSLHEGWFNEFKIESSSAIERLKAYLSFCGIGAPPMYFSVNLRDFMLRVSGLIASQEDKFSFVNEEKFFNYMRLACGSIISINRPLYLRDMTFIGRGDDDPIWDRPDLDDEANQLLCESICSSCDEFSSPAEVVKVFDEAKAFTVTNGGQLIEMRSLMSAAQPWLSDYLASSLKPSTLAACKNAWAKTLDCAYPNTLKSQLGVPGFWRRRAHQLINLMGSKLHKKNL